MAKRKYMYDYYVRQSRGDFEPEPEDVYDPASKRVPQPPHKAEPKRGCPVFGSFGGSLCAKYCADGSQISPKPWYQR